MGRVGYSSFSFPLASDTRTDVILEISTLSFARGNRALKIYGKPNDALSSTSPVSNLSLLSPSLHANFDIIDDFSDYEEGTFAPESRGWSNDSYALSAPFGKILETTMNFEDRHGISLWGKSDFNTCLYIAFEDSYGHKSNYEKLGFLSKRWKRMECPISDSIGNVSMSSITKILFEYDSEPNSEFFIDEIVVFGFDEGNKNKQWIPMLITDAETDKTGRIVVSEVAGGYGDVIHQDKASSLRGEIIFKTGHSQMDNDIRFVDGSRRRQTKLFLRVGSEGWPIYVSDYTQRPEESIYGVRSEVSLKFIEAE